MREREGGGGGGLKASSIKQVNDYSPAVGSSRKIRGGLASRDMAVDSFLLFPPEYVPAALSAYSLRSSFSRAQSTTLDTCAFV